MADPTWPAVAMTVALNLGGWLVVLRSIRRSNGSRQQLKDIKDTVNDTNTKLGSMEGKLGKLTTEVAKTNTRFEGMEKTCSETRRTFSENIKLNADRIFYHVTSDHREKP